MTTYRLTVTLELEGAAFDGYRANEAARILRRLAEELEHNQGRPMSDGENVGASLRDVNGNRCGKWAARRVRRIGA